MDVTTVLVSALSSGAAATVGSYIVQRGIGHAFDLHIEDKRAGFARDLESQRQAAQLALEGFKSQLTLEAEVRRQAAGKKVEALLTIAAIVDGTPSLIQRTLGVDGESGGIAAVDEYLGAVRKAEAFLDLNELREMYAFGAMLQGSWPRVMNSLKGIERVDVMAVSQKAEESRRSVMARIRQELQLELAPGKLEGKA
jgi:hypothetical protein